MNRREFITLFAKASLLVAAPLPVLAKPSPEKRAFNDLDDYARLESMTPIGDGSSWEMLLVFTKPRYDEFHKRVRVSQLANAVNADIKSEISYQISKSFLEVARDYLHLEHGQGWRKFDTKERKEVQQYILLQDLKVLNNHN